MRFVSTVIAHFTDAGCCTVPDVNGIIEGEAQWRSDVILKAQPIGLDKGLPMSVPYPPSYHVRIIQDKPRPDGTAFQHLASPSEVEQPRGSHRSRRWTGGQPGCVGASCSGASCPLSRGVEQVGCAAESRRAQEEVRGTEQVVPHAALIGY